MPDNGPVQRDVRTDQAGLSDVGGFVVPAGVDLVPSVATRLFDAAMSVDPDACSDAVAHAVSKRISVEDIADYYIPAIACKMGDLWCADEMSFASVTIGVARLQAMLRSLGPAWEGDRMASPLAPTSLVVVPRDIHHYLGAMILTGKLRRLGMSVRLLLDATPGTVKAKMQQCRFDAVFLSASCGASLEQIRKIVESAKVISGHQPPVVIGGAIRTEVPEVARLTGADHATNDPVEAIALCNLTERCASDPKITQGLG